MRTFIKRRRGQQSGYERIDVRDLVHDWFSVPQENYGIRIETSSNGTTEGLSVNNFLDVDGEDSELVSGEERRR